MLRFRDFCAGPWCETPAYKLETLLPYMVLNFTQQLRSSFGSFFAGPVLASGFHIYLANLRHYRYVCSEICGIAHPCYRGLSLTRVGALGKPFEDAT